MIDAFTLPEKIVGKNVTLIKRDHNFDRQMWEAVERNREFLRTYLFWVDKTNSFDDVAAATKLFDLWWAEQSKFAYVISDKHSQKLLGCIDIHNIDLTNCIAEIGYWLREEKTGFGYMSEAVGLIEAEAFAKGIRRIEISCDEANVASANVAKRCGYQYEGTQKEAIYTYGEFHNRQIYVKLNPAREKVAA